MATDPQTLLSQSNCFACFTSQQWKLMVLALWAELVGGASNCGTPSGVIRITGAGTAGANQFYTQQSPSTWSGQTNSAYQLDLVDGVWLLDFYTTGPTTLYQSAAMRFPCTWVIVNGSANAPTGSYQ